MATPIQSFKELPQENQKEEKAPTRRNSGVPVTTVVPMKIEENLENKSFINEAED
jgi:hypothetical protein